MNTKLGIDGLNIQLLQAGAKFELKSITIIKFYTDLFSLLSAVLYILLFSNQFL